MSPFARRFLEHVEIIGAIPAPLESLKGFTFKQRVHLLIMMQQSRLNYVIRLPRV